MEIAIWGTGIRGTKVKTLCEMLGDKVKVFIDNDVSRWGSELNGVKIVAPEYFTKMYGDSFPIWIATAAPEVYIQAQKISKNVLKWDYLSLMLGANKQRPNFPEIQVKSCNIENCKLLTDREEFLKQFAGVSNKWKMAEVGVAYGDFSSRIWNICKPEKLYLIDAWEGERYGQGFIEVANRFEKEIAAGTVEMRRGYSVEQLETFPDGMFDWIYIDTVHDYETTRAELKICSNKIAQNGYICGHDYTKYNVHSRIDYGVYDAVNEFAVEYGYEFIYLTIERAGLQSFALKKIQES